MKNVAHSGISLELHKMKSEKIRMAFRVSTKLIADVRRNILSLEV